MRNARQMRVGRIEFAVLPSTHVDHASRCYMMFEAQRGVDLHAPSDEQNEHCARYELFMAARAR